MINAAHGTLPIRFYNQIRLWLRSAAPVKSATEIIYNAQGKKKSPALFFNSPAGVESATRNMSGAEPTLCLVNKLSG